MLSCQDIIAEIPFWDLAKGELSTDPFGEAFGAFLAV